MTSKRKSVASTKGKVGNANAKRGTKAPNAVFGKMPNRSKITYGNGMGKAGAPKNMKTV